ncbi:hypothetical protein [Photobacterium leiognathi]|uniref:hypothetical protein n=1 Tax=Photobacterium leiognathi TaxID=553611 RepID=UPI002981B613|nr:hypothetical protein [Photobacterium leiognathi]
MMSPSPITLRNAINCAVVMSFANSLAPIAIKQNEHSAPIIHNIACTDVTSYYCQSDKLGLLRY